MKFLLLIALFLSQNILSQTIINGAITNGIDNSKLASASIFINNSSLGTISDDEGKFILTGVSEKNIDLIISYAGFQTVVLKITQENIRQLHEVKMFPKKQYLEEIAVMSPDINGWKKWERLFTENFIGTSDFAKECLIKNPEVLRFFYNKKDSIIKAYSHGNIIIYNKALGYNIRYQLEEFIDNQRTGIISYSGYTGFEDLNTKNEHKQRKWEHNRQTAYEGSIMHFMRSVYADSVSEQGFDVKEKIRIHNKDSAFTQIYRNGNIPKTVMLDGLEYNPVASTEKTLNNLPEFIYLISTKPVSFKTMIIHDTLKQQAVFYFLNHLNIRYKNVKPKEDYLFQNDIQTSSPYFAVSDISLVNDNAILIEKHGAYYNPLNIVSTGYWAWCKMGETLPNDYIFDK